MSFDTIKAKVLVMGPKRCGKTRIANFLAKHDEAPNFGSYTPTKGARILEFEEGVLAGKKNVTAAVELWDCSGDRQYEGCWPAILRDVSGVVLVYDPSVKEQEKDIELWYKSFAARLGLKEGQVLLLAHTAAGNGRTTYQAPRTLDKFKFMNSTLDSEDVARTLRETFKTFLGSVAVGAKEKQSADMDAAMSGF